MIGLFVFMGFVHVSTAQYPFGRPCGGGCAPPMCQPRMPCSAPMPMPMPVQIPCPPPPPCPAQFCPPPPICPPPPPPMPCPLPPPPPPRPACPCMSRPSFYPTFMPQYYQQPMQIQQPIQFPQPGGCGGGGAVMPTVRIPAQNDCCCGCSSPCRYKSVRRAAFAAKTVDPSCNSEEIKTIIQENIGEDASESKRNIQKAAEEALGFDINVICGNGEFSYIAHTDTFCQTSKDDITCYAFKPL